MNIKLLHYAIAIVALTMVMIMLTPMEDKRYHIGVIYEQNNTELTQAIEFYQSRINKYNGIGGLILDFVQIKEGYSDANLLKIINLKNVDNTELLELYRVAQVRRSFRDDLGTVPSVKTLKQITILDKFVNKLPKVTLESKEEILNHVSSVDEKLYKSIGNPVKVFVGTKLKSIDKIELSNVTYTMDFYLWFRWDAKRDIDADNVILTNTIDRASLLGTDPKATTKVTLVSDKNVTIHKKKFRYVEYRIQADFKGLEVKNYSLAEQNLPIQIIHKDKNIKSIIYTADTISKEFGLHMPIEILTREKLEELEYSIVKADGIYLHYVLPYCDRGYRNSSLSCVDFPISIFTIRYGLKQDKFTIRGLEARMGKLFYHDTGQINMKLALLYLLFTLLLLMLVYELKVSRKLTPTIGVLVWIANIINLFIVLVIGEFLTTAYLHALKVTVWGASNLHVIEELLVQTQITVGIAWWIIPTYYITSALDVFVWIPLEQKSGTPTPKVLKSFIVAILYAMAIIGIMAFVFEVTTNSLMATSGAFAILFAIMSKIDLTNLIAGLGISFAKTIRLGEWVSINGNIGEIVAMTPRDIQILTPTNSIITIPNSNIGTATIENMSKESAFRSKIRLEIVPNDIEKVEQVFFEATITVEGVMLKPKPFVAFLGQGDSCQIWEIYFFMKDGSEEPTVLNEVWRSVWKTCDYNSIIMATPQREHKAI